MRLVKNKYEINLMREAGKIGVSILNELINNIKSGITTKEINEQAIFLCLKYKVNPAFLQYNGFPFAICTSINEEIVHCLPSNRVLKPGDMVRMSLEFYQRRGLGRQPGRREKTSDRFQLPDKFGVEIPMPQIY